MRRQNAVVALCAAALVLAGAPGAQASGAGWPRQDKTPPKIVFVNPAFEDRVLIDGAKNPEMIPEWDAWGSAFDALKDFSDIPTRVKDHLTPEGVELVRAAVTEAADNRRAAEQRLMKLLPTLQTNEARLINDRTRELQLEHRGQTLRLRDRLLAELPTDGGTALSAWVEQRKAGMQVSVPKSDLAFYRQPQ